MLAAIAAAREQVELELYLVGEKRSGIEGAAAASTDNAVGTISKRTRP